MGEDALPDWWWIPLVAILACCLIVVVAALLFWRKRRNSRPAESPSTPGMVAISYFGDGDVEMLSARAEGVFGTGNVTRTSEYASVGAIAGTGNYGGSPKGDIIYTTAPPANNPQEA